MKPHALVVVALALTWVTGCASPPAVGTVGEALVISPLVYDFGSFAVGTPSPRRGVVISPNSAGVESDTVLSVTESCVDFELDLSDLEPLGEVYRRCDDGTLPDLNLPESARGLPCGGTGIYVTKSQRFAVTFSPSLAGVQSCTIAISMESGPRTIEMRGTGLAPPVALAVVTPASSALAFGDVVVGAASTNLPITIRSDGATALDLTSAVIGGPDAAGFAAQTASVEPISQGQTYTWQLTCTPPGPGALSATFTITSNAGTTAFALSCNGIQSNLTVAPSPVQFEETLLGASRSVNAAIGNSGTAALVITSTLVTAGPFVADDLGGTTLGPGDLAPLTITFTPEPDQDGMDVRGTLVVSFDDGDSRTIDLVGPAREATLSLTPSSAIDFGTVCGGQRADQLFVALNTGSGGVELSDAVVTGAGFTLTPVAPSSFPAPLPARGAGSVTFQVSAAPATGEATGELTVTTAIPGSTPSVIALHALGQDSGIGASPLDVDFGGVSVSETSGGRTVRINNCDVAPLELTRATLVGDQAAEFIAVSADQPLPITLAPGASALFLVELRPTAIGDKAATLEIVHGAGTTSVPLTGFGLGDPVPGGGGGDRGSYYACSAGGSAGGLAGLVPVAGGLGLLLRRRRRRA